MKQFRNLLVVTSILITGIIGCKKGDTGPAGPVGPAGPDSVVYSNWITLNFTFNLNDSAFEDTLIAPAITQGILDSGVILTYIEFPDQNKVMHVQSMDAVSGIVAALGGVIFEDYTPGKINIATIGIDLSKDQYRYVVIPGSRKAGNNAAVKVKGYTPAELKAMSYEQVQQVLSDKN